MRDLFTCPSCLGMSRCHACVLRNSECHVCVRLALAVVGARSRSPRTAPDRAKGLERGLQMEEESEVFSNIKVRVKRMGLQSLGIWR